MSESIFPFIIVALHGGRRIQMRSIEKAKNIEGLMQHLQNDCGISISGNIQKQQLIQYGYYHGYKGYRFYNYANNKIPYTNFEELIAVIEYDNTLKGILYPALMFIEMAIKNIALSVIVPDMKDTSIHSIYLEKMNDDANNRDLKVKRLKIRDRIQKNLSDSYSHKNVMVSHFYNKGEEVPLWAIFEIMMLGDFADLLQCLNKNVRERIADSLDMNLRYDTDSQLVANALFTIKSLRNATAHNNIVFDARFKDRGTNKNLIHWVETTTGITNVKFDVLSDYIVLIFSMLKHVGYSEKKSNCLLEEYKEALNTLYKSVPLPIYNKIVHTGIQGKLIKIENFIKK